VAAALTLQVVAVPAEAHAPPHRAKTEPADARAVSVRSVPSLTVAVQLVPQFRALVLAVTVPEPVPSFVT
jgi:hypothetical protein